MQYNIYLMSTINNWVEASEVVEADNRADALGQAKELGWPVRRTRARRRRKGKS